MSHRKTFITHPNNKRLIEDALFSYGSQPFQPSDMLGAIGISIQANALMKERKIEHKWHPPENDSFVEYEESDRGWLKALGAGRQEEIDHGPLIYELNDSLYMSFISPT